MSRTFGSFEDLLNKLKQFLETGRWSKEICIESVDGEHHYLRLFNYDRSEETRKLELDIPANQEAGPPMSIEFEELKNGNYKITVANYTASGLSCQDIDPMFWWKYKETPRLNAKGGKRRKTRKKRNKRKNKTRKCKNKWSVSTNFDAGNIIKKRCETIDNINIYTLEIKKDPYPKFTKKKYQNWYYFQVNNVKGKKCKFIIENLVNIDNDWKSHNVVYTYDNRQFYRHPTKLNEKKNCISWEFKPKKNKIWFSYYVPYSRKRVYNLNSKIAKRKGVSKIILGRTSLNNKIELLRFGKGLKHIFMIARQHPGETIGSWMLEGFLKSLFSTSFKQQSNILFDKFTFHIISMVNPDGVQLGHWYTQKHGHNCNREWVKKSCPEVKMISKYMKKYEGSLYFDFHGDEGCKKHFFTTCDSTKKDKDSSWDFFRNRMKHYNKYFDKEDYYKKAAHKVHGTFDCCWNNSLTLEGCMKHNYKKRMPYLRTIVYRKRFIQVFL